MTDTYLAKVNDVVQIDPEHDPVFGGCLLVVTDVKTWGVQGYVNVPDHPRSAQAYYRVPNDKIAYVGRAEWAQPRHQEPADAR